jgi:hypothetical protein
MKNLEWDNLLALLIIGVLGGIAMWTRTADNQIVTSIISGMIGYIAKGSIRI